ncbi:MAG: DoxX family protein [Acidobacteriaceae bacterium]
MSQWLNRRQPWGFFALRLALALAMVVHGYEKLALHHFLNHALEMSYWLGHISALTEFMGGILLFLGLFTRFAAALIAIDMLAALFAAGIHSGFGVYSYVLAMVAMALMLVFSGGGVMSADRKFGIS